MKMRIDFFLTNLNGGGAQGVCVNISNHLSKKGWKVVLWILNSGDKAYLQSISKDVDVNILNIPSTFKSTYTLLKILKKKEVKTVVIFSYELTMLIVFLSSIYKLDLTIVSRSVFSIPRILRHEKLSIKTRLLINLLPTFLNHCDLIVNQCQEMQLDLLSSHPKLKSKCSVIYNMPSVYKEDRDINPNIKMDKYILCVGRLEHQKAVHKAITAFSRYLKEHPKSTNRLKIAGKGSLKNALEKLSHDEKISHRIDFLGFRDDLTELYQNADGVILTSLHEGFPNVLIESITLGTPVISVDCSSGPSEIVEHNVNGYLIKQATDKNLADAIYKIFQGSICRLRTFETSKRFSPDEITEKWENLLHRLISRDLT